MLVHGRVAHSRYMVCDRFERKCLSTIGSITRKEVDLTLKDCSDARDTFITHRPRPNQYSIIIPDIAPLVDGGSTPAIDEFLNYVFGGLKHECAHVEDTDFDALEEAVNKHWWSKYPGIRKRLWNLIEDPWIEHRLVKRTGSHRLDIEATLDHFFNPKAFHKVEFEGAAKKKYGEELYEAAMEVDDFMVGIRLFLSSRDYSWMRPKAARLVSSHAAYLAELIDHESTSKNIGVVSPIFNKLMLRHFSKSAIKTLEEILNPKDGGSGDGDDESEGGTANTREKEVARKVYEKLLAKAIAAHRRITSRIHKPHPLCKKYDKIVVVQSDDSTREEYEKSLKLVQSQLPGLRTKLLKYIVATSAPKVMRNLLDGDDIDDEAIIDYATTRDEHVYTTTIPRAKSKAAISLLVDMSGSMAIAGAAGKLSKSDAARASVIAAAEVFSTLRVPFRVAGFTSDSISHPELVKEYEKTKHIYNRFTAIKHHIFKDWHEPYLLVRHRLGGIKAVWDNSDPDHIEVELEALLRRREPRKILVIYSDGMPSCWMADGATLSNGLKQVVAKCERLGVSVIGIGLLTDYVKRYYPRCVIINRIEDILPKTYEAFSQLLQETIAR